MNQEENIYENANELAQKYGFTITKKYVYSLGERIPVYCKEDHKSFVSMKTMTQKGCNACPECFRIYKNKK